MRFADFQFSFGSLDVELSEESEANRAKLEAFCCAGCNFIGPRSFWCFCGHAHCERCVFILGGADEDQISQVQCSVCYEETDAILMEVPEVFVAALFCFCPHCGVTQQLSNMKDHLAQCIRTRIMSSRSERGETDTREGTPEGSVNDDSTDMEDSCAEPYTEKALADDGRVTEDQAPARNTRWREDHFVEIHRIYHQHYVSSQFFIGNTPCKIFVSERFVRIIAERIPDNFQRTMKGQMSVVGLGSTCDKPQPFSEFTPLGAPKNSLSLLLGKPANIDSIPAKVKVILHLEKTQL